MPVADADETKATRRSISPYASMEVVEMCPFVFAPRNQLFLLVAMVLYSIRTSINKDINHGSMFWKII
jgi:hypothetical protein